MNTKSILLAVGLCAALWAAPTTAASLVPANAERSVAAGNCLFSGDISGKLGAFVHGADGLTYFMIDSNLMVIDTKSFLEMLPEPVAGMKVTATGCTKDPNGIADFACTKVTPG